MYIVEHIKGTGMKYIIMCGGTYEKWKRPRQLTVINGETVVGRTIRLLEENGVHDIAISTNLNGFGGLGVHILNHENTYHARGYDDFDGYWFEAFYPTTEPVCYIFGDVFFSPEAIRKIVRTDTKEIELFASSPPFDPRYPKEDAEPFALKVVNRQHFEAMIERTKEYAGRGAFRRKPIMWELWQVIKGTPLNIIDYNNYTVINDYTCDIDSPEDIEFYKNIRRR